MKQFTLNDVMRIVRFFTTHSENYILKVIESYSKGEFINSKFPNRLNVSAFNEDDLLDFHEYCKDNPQLTHQELIKNFKNNIHGKYIK